MTLETVLTRLKGVKATGDNKWQALCPAHKDSKPSLSISKGDNGKVLFHCFGGCTYEQICSALGLKNEPSNRHLKSVFDYRDELGKLLYQVCRFEPKSFSQRRPDGQGGWIWNLVGVHRVLYRLPELIAADRKALVLLPEGEGKVERLRNLGLIATCNSGGAGKWFDEYNPLLQGRPVVILPDNDLPGKRHAQQVAESLCGTASVVKIVTLPVPEKGDVSDWLDNGGTVAQLIDLIDKTEPYQPECPAIPARPGDAGFHLTDCGNAERFAARHGDKVRYCWTWDKWLYYGGEKWDAEVGGEMARRLAIKTARALAAEADDKNHDERGRFLRWSLASESAHRISAMLSLAQAIQPVASYARDFDANPWLLNCLNGTIDLRTGKLRPHSPDDMLTRLCPVKYDPDARLELWDDFLFDVVDGDETLMRFLQRAAGYSTCGDTGEEKLFFIHGATATGKSTCLEGLKSALGDYAQTSDFETFLARNSFAGPRNDIARLNGARLVASIEVEEGKRLAEGLVKMLTGGDTISARFLYRESFEFLPQFKLWLAANHAPRIKDDDDAIWRRILRIPFNHIIPKDKQDPKVKATLRDPQKAGPAVLAWLVKGCLMWQEQGLNVPEIVERATEDYRADQDPLKDFFEDRCEFSPESFVPVAKLRAAYEQWATDNGVRFTLGSREFNKRVRSRGCEDKTTRRSGYISKCWNGIGLRIDFEECNRM